MRRRQTGSVLLLAMVMLSLLSLAMLGALTSVKQSLNLQHRDELSTQYEQVLPEAVPNLAVSLMQSDMLSCLYRQQNNNAFFNRHAGEWQQACQFPAASTVVRYLVETLESDRCAKTWVYDDGDQHWVFGVAYYRVTLLFSHEKWSRMAQFVLAKPISSLPCIKPSTVVKPGLQTVWYES